MPLVPLQSNDFSGMRLKLASPERMLSWSYGEVTRPETINYRTQKPEKSGLFAEEIFGPSKDWECFCGKYKKIRYKGIVCDKCGVEVTRSIVRRERMGAIRLATPVSHIWFLRGVPSKIGLVLDLSVQNLEKVIYFANFIITSVDATAKQQTLDQIRDEYKSKHRQIEGDGERKIQEIRNTAHKEEVTAGEATADASGETEAKTPALSKKVLGMIEAIDREKKARLAELDEAFSVAEEELKELVPLAILTEHAYQSLSLKYGHVFDAKIGAEAIHHLLKGIQLKETTELLEKEAVSVEGARREKIMRRLKLMKSFIKNQIDPAWMMLTVVPVIPPDLRPMVPLDGGRYATSDLNDLYRRVINRNNRLQQLQELNAPEVIVRNEKRMLQEAVDALIDNSARHGKTVMASTGQKRMLKSLADMLKGKQGRFRQNLLGKRVDYSGRSVIVVGSHLKLNQCGLPKKMAMELFKPFVMSKLIERGFVHNVRSASRFIESGRSEIWDILEEITKDRYVLLNRAPTLHRLGIQAFRPILIEGKAIQLHPLVCAAFNADFDGDQMAVHVPLTEEAQKEAGEIMLSTKNLLKPATGDPVMTPNQDIVLGCYYLTYEHAAAREDTKKYYANVDEVLLAYRIRGISLRAPVLVRMQGWHQAIDGLDAQGFLSTTPGRLIFNQILPSKIPFQNQLMDKKKLGKLVRAVLQEYGQEATAELLDDMKELAFKYLTRSGLSWGISDLPVLGGKKALMDEAHRIVDEVQTQFDNGLLTESERRVKVISIWNDVKEKVVELSKRSLDTGGPVFAMIDSGARGSWGQLTQMIGMKGLVTNPTGDIIELPVKGSFKEGFTVLEYFISTHGARKGLSDTALRTANAGYLTRRLVDVAQELVIREEDCGDTEGVTLTRAESEAMGEPILERILGRVLVDAIKDPETKKTIVKKGEAVTDAAIKLLKNVTIESIRVRSLLSCKSRKGVCEHCYGYDLGYNKPVSLGVPVGIIAAQSIGEPGTQLTMRTFHTGGVAGQDITQGLPRVEEIFEVRPPKKRAFIAEVNGRVAITEAVEVQQDGEQQGTVKSGRRQKLIQIHYRDAIDDTYPLAASGVRIAPGGAGDTGEKKKKRGRAKKIETADAGVGVDVRVKDGSRVAAGAILFVDTQGRNVTAERGGKVRIDPVSIHVLGEADQMKEYIIPFGYGIGVKDGLEVRVGDPLTEGSLDLHQLFSLKGKEAVQKYIVREIQSIYTSQGQKVNDKHIEAIIRQMFSRVYVKKAGDTNLLPSETVEKAEYLEENLRIAREGGEPAEADELLLGISRVSLSTQSFLASASFQETARVLINAAIMGRVDHLEGLKENVIIGRLIPAGTGFRKEVVVKADGVAKDIKVTEEAAVNA